MSLVRHLDAMRGLKRTSAHSGPLGFDACEPDDGLSETSKKAHAFANCIALIVSAVPSTRITRLRL